eukprot:jgi/Picsp_1/389/NSC_00387-R1_---NA---
MKYEKNREANALAEISRAIAKQPQQLTRNTDTVATVAESEDLDTDLDTKDSSIDPDSADMSESVSTSTSTENSNCIEEGEEKEKEEVEEKNEAPSQMMESEEEKEKTRADEISEPTKAFINHFEKDLEKILHNTADSRVSEKAMLYGIDAMMWTLEASTKRG